VVHLDPCPLFIVRFSIVAQGPNDHARRGSRSFFRSLPEATGVESFLCAGI
jgi:hypothetical protein